MSSYGGGSMMRMKPAPKGTHRMPDGTLMTGTKHSKSSKPISEAKAKAQAKKKPEEIEFKEGTLRAMLRVPKDMKLTVPVLKKINVDVGKEFTFNGKKFKMTPLMKKRVQLGINLQSRR